MIFWWAASASCSFVLEVIHDIMISVLEVIRDIMISVLEVIRDTLVLEVCVVVGELFNREVLLCKGASESKCCVIESPSSGPAISAPAKPPPILPPPSTTGKIQ